MRRWIVKSLLPFLRDVVDVDVKYTDGILTVVVELAGLTLITIRRRI